MEREFGSSKRFRMSASMPCRLSIIGRPLIDHLIRVDFVCFLVILIVRIEGRFKSFRGIEGDSIHATI